MRFTIPCLGNGSQKFCPVTEHSPAPGQNCLSNGGHMYCEVQVTPATEVGTKYTLGGLDGTELVIGLIIVLFIVGWFGHIMRPKPPPKEIPKPTSRRR